MTEKFTELYESVMEKIRLDEVVKGEVKPFNSISVISQEGIGKDARKNLKNAISKVLAAFKSNDVEIDDKEGFLERPVSDGSVSKNNLGALAKTVKELIDKVDEVKGFKLNGKDLSDKDLDKLIKELGTEKSDILKVILNASVKLPAAFLDKMGKSAKYSKSAWDTTPIIDFISQGKIANASKTDDKVNQKSDGSGENKRVLYTFDINAMEKNMDSVKKELAKRYWKHMEESEANVGDNAKTKGFMAQIPEEERKEIFNKIFNYEK